jgi:hypothetical protein
LDSKDCVLKLTSFCLLLSSLVLERRFVIHALAIDAFPPRFHLLLTKSLASFQYYFVRAGRPHACLPSYPLVVLAPPSPFPKFYPHADVTTMGYASVSTAAKVHLFDCRIMSLLLTARIQLLFQANFLFLVSRCQFQLPKIR